MKKNGYRWLHDGQINIYVDKTIIIHKNVEVKTFSTNLWYIIIMRNYGEYLKEIRISNGKTLLDVQKDTGISNQNLSRWERGEVIPSIAFCEILADYYDVTIDELIGRDKH